MVNFEDFTLEGKDPIYQQILLYIKRGAVSGVISDGEELPSRRSLSALLGINPNTVQKAFALLEEEGLISTRAGQKSVLILNDDVIRRLRAELLSEEMKSVTRDFREMGISMEEAITLLRKYWEEDEI